MPSGDSVPFDAIALLDALEGVDFIIVGGAAAALHGGPRVTFDLDIVPATSESNLHALASALRALDAVVREPGNRVIPMTLDLLEASRVARTGGQIRLRTTKGPLDILWRLHDGRGYGELLAGAVTLSDDERQVRVIGLDDLIDVKSRAGRPQDLDDVRYLEQVRSRRGPR